VAVVQPRFARVAAAIGDPMPALPETVRWQAPAMRGLRRRADSRVLDVTPVGQKGLVASLLAPSRPVA
jgi:hypothetical protein